MLILSTLLLIIEYLRLIHVFWYFFHCVLLVLFPLMYMVNLVILRKQSEYYWRFGSPPPLVNALHFWPRPCLRRLVMTWTRAQHASDWHFTNSGRVSMRSHRLYYTLSMLYEAPFSGYCVCLQLWRRSVDSAIIGEKQLNMLLVTWEYCDERVVRLLERSS